jgi:hypothetical protein
MNQSVTGLSFNDQDTETWAVRPDQIKKRSLIAEFVDLMMAIVGICVTPE